MKATLPYPPSANRYWRSFRGRMVLSAEAKKYKAFVQVALAKWPILGGPVALIAHLYRPQKSGDLDNRLKVLGDALNGVAWLDDKQIEEIHAFRHDDKARPRVEIEVRALGVESELGPRQAPKADWLEAMKEIQAESERLMGPSPRYVVTPAYQKAQTDAVLPKRKTK